jgi:hypothetical protein
LEVQQTKAAESKDLTAFSFEGITPGSACPSASSFFPKTLLQSECPLGRLRFLRGLAHAFEPSTGSSYCVKIKDDLLYAAF